jgi:hypothetical protein
MHCHFIPTSRQQLRRHDAVMTKEAMHAMRIEIARAAVMKGQHPAAIPRQKKRRRQPRRPRADNYAIVNPLIHFSFSFDWRQSRLQSGDRIAHVVNLL